MSEKKNNAFSKALLLSLLLALLLVSSAKPCFALGVSPGDKTLQFFSGESIDLFFSVVNSEGAELDVSLSSYGELEDSVFFQNESLHLASDAYLTPFKLVFKMPEQLSPGVHTSYIRITPKTEASNDMFRAFVSPVIPINVRVPYPSKYADVNIVAFAVDEGTPVMFNLEFDNLGSEDILSAGGTIEVLDSKGDIVESLIAPEISIGKNSYGKSEASNPGVLRRGSYIAIADAHYDSVNVSVSKNFTLGTPSIAFELLSDKLSQGEINQVKFKARLDWDSALPVKAFIKLNGVEREMPLFTLVPGKESVLTGFADATETGLGDADLEVRLVYASSIKTEKYKVQVVPKEMLTSISDSVSLNKLVVIVLLVLLIVILLVMLYIYLKRKRGKGCESDDEDSTKPLNSPPLSNE